MILIVDDQKDTGTALERMVRYAGHEAAAANEQLPSSNGGLSPSPVEQATSLKASE